MTARALDVWFSGEVAGQLTEQDGVLNFTYASDWEETGRVALSQSLPLDGAFSQTAVHAFFGGLLPEGDLRDLLGQRLGVSATNDFSLLEQLGGDCAGAITIYPAGQALPTRESGVRWLSDDELRQLVHDLPSRPMYAEPDGELRLSLAGAQDKIPVVVENSRVGLPTGDMPSTHILKTPISRLPATVLNEALWSRVGKRLGITCATSRPLRVGDSEVLLVERYDRTVEDGHVKRLHQEDVCQALAIPSTQKYQREGGPGLTDCFAVLRSAAPVPARELPRLLDAWALSFIAANHDAHGKNFSLLYTPEGATTLAPVYDVLNTAAYWKVKEMDRKMAMSVGGEYRPAYVKGRHIDRMLDDAGLGVAPSRRRLAALARDAPDAITDARRELVHEAWDHEHLDNVVEMSLRRARTLADATRPRQRAAV